MKRKGLWVAVGVTLVAALVVTGICLRRRPPGTSLSGVSPDGARVVTAGNASTGIRTSQLRDEQEYKTAIDGHVGERNEMVREAVRELEGIRDAKGKPMDLAHVDALIAFLGDVGAKEAVPVLLDLISYSGVASEKATKRLSPGKEFPAVQALLKIGFSDPKEIKRRIDRTPVTPLDLDLLAFTLGELHGPQAAKAIVDRSSSSQNAKTVIAKIDEFFVGIK
jgi:hypothetical protein